MLCKISFLCVNNTNMATVLDLQITAVSREFNERVKKFPEEHHCLVYSKY